MPSLVLERILDSLRNGYGQLDLSAVPMSFLDKPDLRLEVRTLPIFDLDVYQNGVLVLLEDADRQLIVEALLKMRLLRDSLHEPERT